MESKVRQGTWKGRYIGANRVWLLTHIPSGVTFTDWDHAKEFEKIWKVEFDNV